MAVFLYQYCLVPALKEVTDPLVPLVKCLSVYTIKLPHARREISIRCLYNEVVVIVHKTIGMANPVVTLADLKESIKESLSIHAIFINSLLFVSSARYMVDSTGVFNAQWT